MKISKRLINKKLLVIIIAVTFIFCALIGKLMYVQVFNRQFYVQKAFSQWTRDLPNVANRGIIKDRNGIELAQSTTTYTLYSRPNEIIDSKDIANKIYKIIDLDYNLTLEKLNKKGVSEVTIKKNLNHNQLVNLISLDLNGLYVTANSKRINPYGNFLTQTLGFVSSDNVGQNGLELFYDDYLMGKNGYSYTQTDLVGKKLKDSKTTYLKSTDGLSLNLTIDFNYQSFVEKAVLDAFKIYDAKKVSCVMMNANSGEILALAQAPTYNLNDIPRNDIKLLNEQSKLSILCDVYEPGSTFKIITSAIGLENNKIKSSYYCPGFSIVDGQRIKCWRSIGHSSQDFKQGIANSCNCVFMDIALSVGVENLYNGYEKFGLFNKTGIDFPGEVNSIKIKKDLVKNVDLARMGFGQAIAITPIQLVCAVSSIINGGNLYAPYLVSSVKDEKLDKEIVINTPKVKQKTLSVENSKIMKEYLFNVVENGGGKNAKIEGYKIGGKTGTSQKYENGTIARGKYLSSFLGFTKVFDEEIVCLFLVDEPKGYAYYGSIVAAPFVKNIFQSIFDFKNVNKLEEENIEYLQMPNLVGLSLAQASAILKSKNIDYHYQGENGYVYYQIPEKNFMIKNNQIIYFCVG